ncbi:MAG: lytic transglycosylase domain-containing protein [Sphingomonadales bacterium]|nr:lytic transglycosylase domain-containing protein [Sphingomonadales bacterium]
MSSVHRRAASLLLLALVVLSAPAQCQDGAEWDRARAALMASEPTAMAQVIARWQMLTGPGSAGFDQYAGFLLAYPGFPEEHRLRIAAEKALDHEAVAPARAVAFFDRFAPLTNPARAQYALALATLGRPEARAVARAAWRGGSMSDAAAATLLASYGGDFTRADDDARIDALLWDGNTAQASAELTRVSPGARTLASARLAMLAGDLGEADPALLADPGYVYTRARMLEQTGQGAFAASLLASRPMSATLPLDPRRWLGLELTAARAGSAADAVRIAERASEGFAAGTAIAQESFAIRDDYTSLVWLGGTEALWMLADPDRASRLFALYGAAGRTPQTRAKGFYWAGRALAEKGDASAASADFERAAAYPDQFYGMLALERLGRPLPNLADPAHPAPDPAARAAFDARPLTQAVREVARNGDWQTTIRFFREIAAQAQSDSDRALVAELARSLGRRDLGVVLGQAVTNEGSAAWRDVSFPLIPTPPGTDWTMVHAIAHQESQFSQNAISHSGARGLMQLMPATAQAEAAAMGTSYSTAALTDDPLTNLRLGDGWFSHLMTVYGGSYPLAIAAYNSGTGNVNRWLRDNGDPRISDDWVDWIERIPFTETRGYVQHVIENAVVYEALYPAHARYRGPAPASHFLTKRKPG